jgi:hypothetical protein
VDLGLQPFEGKGSNVAVAGLISSPAVAVLRHWTAVRLSFCALWPKEEGESGLIFVCLSALGILLYLFSCLHWHFRLLIFLHCVIGIEVGRSSRLSFLLFTAHSNGRSLWCDTPTFSCRCRSHRPFQSNCQLLLFSFPNCLHRRLGKHVVVMRHSHRL